ncbi:Clostridial hydrophobic W [Clostridiales bacterium CHKCI001]|nr:Clostridial hydrophobic W [Clostridiales bacterium CHKCI001]
MEVMQEVDGNNVTLFWYPVNGDRNPVNYEVQEAIVSLEGELLTAQLNNLEIGAHKIQVNYKGSVPKTDEVLGIIFQHTGISHSQEELTAMKEHIAKKEEPWYSDYQKLKSTVSDQMSSWEFTPNAQEGVGIGTPEGHGNIVSFEQSANAAYFNALQWVITGEDKYTNTAVEVLNAWANQLKIVDGRDRILGAAISSYEVIGSSIELSASAVPGYQFVYWLDVTTNKVICEATTCKFTLTDDIEIRTIYEEDAIPGQKPLSISYRTHVQNEGWQEFVADGVMSGTKGKSLRLEGIEICLDNNAIGGSVEYRTHVQNEGWQDWVRDDTMSSTTGKNLRLEAIEIHLVKR